MSDYKDRLRKILDDAYPDITVLHSLSFKNVFGAVAGYVDDHIFCSFGNFGFALKLPSEERDRLLKKGAQPLRYFPKGHVKKDYVAMTDSMIGPSEDLRLLIETSIRFSIKP